MHVSVIVTTYNMPQWLEKTIWGFAAQTHRDFELVIADDGSTDATREKIDEIRRSTGLALQHIWHEDRGFRKCEILNQAIVSSTHEYLVFTDGDCVPRCNFLAQHVSLARRGRFLSGGIVRLPATLSDRLSRQDIVEDRATDIEWLRQQGMKLDRKLWMLARSNEIARLLDRLTPTRPSFNGHNSSAWKSDLLRVNGFDEGMHYGGLDRELGERLENAGVRGLQIRHRAACVHLDHPRSYETAEGWKQNNAIRVNTARMHSVWTPRGIRKLDPPPHPLDTLGSLSPVSVAVASGGPWAAVQRILGNSGRFLRRFPST